MSLERNELKPLPKLRVSLLTGRTIEQGTGKETGKFSEKYLESVSVCQMDPGDIKVLRVKENENIKVTTEFGSVIMKVVESRRAPHSGVVFVPYGPWASVLANPETHGTGMPSLKGEMAEIEPAPTQRLLSLQELLKLCFRRDR